jgi:hypothetical protein
MSHPHNPSSDSCQSASRLGESLAHSTESQRLLVQEMTGFAKGEGQRFVNLRLERNGAAFDRLQNCHGLPGLMGVQQEWLRDFVQDYADQSMRLMDAWRGLARNVMASAAEQASETADAVQQSAVEPVHHAEDRHTDGFQVMQPAGEPINTIGPDTNNNYIQH